MIGLIVHNNLNSSRPPFLRLQLPVKNALKAVVSDAEVIREERRLERVCRDRSYLLIRLSI